MRAIIIGLVLAVATGVGLIMLPVERARDAVAVLLTLIAAIYIGFSLASRGRLPIIEQVAACIFFVALALLGVWVDWWFLVAGLVLHGGWDYLHRGDRGRGIVPRWYVPFCAIYDWAIALFVAIRYAAAG